MNRYKLLYNAMVAAVLILIAIAGFSGIYQSLTRPNESATITTQAIVDVENFSVFHFDVSNREGRDTNYKICTFFENKKECFWQIIGDGRSFT